MEPASSLQLLQLSLSWARLIQSMSTFHFLNIHLIIIFPSKHGFCKWSLSLKFPHQIPVCTSLFHHMCYTPRPSHSSIYDHPDNIWWGYRSPSFPLCSFLLSSVNSSHLVHYRDLTGEIWNGKDYNVNRRVRNL